MCLIAFALNVHNACPLLLASNRDEFWARPTQPLSRWQLPGGATVYGGRDLKAGGTWLGFSENGRVAMLTNGRNGEPDVAPRSRGELVTRWLAGPAVTPDWPALPQACRGSDYGGFNLLLGDIHQQSWVWLSNRADPARAADGTRPLGSGWIGRTLSPGIYGLSNAGLDTPWPKTRRLKQAIAQALSAWTTEVAPASPTSEPVWQAMLRTALLDRQPAADHELPDTGIPLTREQQLSSPFVHMPEVGYGTRSSLIAHWAIHAGGGQLHLDEWTHNPSGSQASSTHRRLSMSTWGMPTSSYSSPTTA